MKFITILLSLYFFILSAIPCMDSEIKTIVSKSDHFTTENNDHSHEKQNDLCSPFCICNCCSAVTLSYSPIINYDFPVQFEKIETLNSIYTSPFYSNFYGSIWQPPQIV